MNDEIVNKLHALLFVHGESMVREVVCQIFKISDEQLSVAVDALSDRLSSTPISVSHSRDGIALVTRPEYGEFLQTIKQSLSTAPLSRAALETLTIILYRPNISKAQIDAIRGVNSTLSLRSLVMRGLIERAVVSGSSHFCATNDTLHHLGINAIDQLPHYAEFTESFEQTTTMDTE